MTTLALLAMSSVVYLTDLDLSPADQGWGQPGMDRSVSGKPLRVGKRAFARGWGSHAPSELILALDGKPGRFLAQVGIDAGTDGPGSVRFQVVADGRVRWQSPVMTRDDAALPVDVDLAGVKTLCLRTSPTADGKSHDHADWAEARFTGGSPRVRERLPSHEGRIAPGRRWRDTRGNLIQAHSGSVIWHGDRYYWFGEERTGGYENHTGVAAYSSKDLLNWTPEGIVMPASAFPTLYRAPGVCERPKVVFNRKTGKFVMWSHLDANGYRESRAGVAVADKITGPYRHVRAYRPIGDETFRDMNLFVDDDGSAYVFYASEGNATMYIVRLSDDYLSHAEPLAEGKTWARAFVNEYREAPAPFKYGGKYYVVTSGCTGWDPNAAQVAVADHPLGPWKSLGNPALGMESDTTFRSQSTFVFAPRGAQPGRFVFMADRWNPKNLGDSRYVWLPLEVEGDRVVVRWRESWHPRDLNR